MKSALNNLINKNKLEKIVNLNDGIKPQDFSDFLNAADFLVIPSRIESIPVVFSDAIQSGTPVISTPVGDLPQLIKNNHCGVVADEISPHAFRH